MSERTAKATGMSAFEQVVASTCDYLRSQWPTELANLKWFIEDIPPGEVDEVRRFSVDEKLMTITIYRVPLQRLSSDRRMDEIEERMHIEHNVFHAVGVLLGHEPEHFGH
jgi:hypothetical protein